MLALASILFAYAAVAAACAGRSHMLRQRWSISPRARLGFHALAAFAIAASVLAWPSGDGAAMAIISVTLAASLAATVFVLLEPVLPRLVVGSRRPGRGRRPGGARRALIARLAAASVAGQDVVR